MSETFFSPMSLKGSRTVRDESRKSTSSTKRSDSHMVLSDAYVKIGTVELDKEGTSVAVNWSAEVASVRVFGQKNARRYDDNPTDWTMEFEFVYNPEDADTFADMIGRKVAVEVR